MLLREVHILPLLFNLPPIVNPRKIQYLPQNHPANKEKRNPSTLKQKKIAFQIKFFVSPADISPTIVRTIVNNTKMVAGLI